MSWFAEYLANKASSYSSPSSADVDVSVGGAGGAGGAAAAAATAAVEAVADAGVWNLLNSD